MAPYQIINAFTYRYHLFFEYADVYRVCLCMLECVYVYAGPMRGRGVAIILEVVRH